MKRLIAVAILVACGGPAKPAAVRTPDGPKQPAALTTAEQIIEASLDKQGGRAALQKITSVHMVGSMNVPQMGVKGTLETWATPPNNSLTHFEIPHMLVDDSGVKGDLAWEKNTLQGARILTGSEKAMALRDAAFNGDLIWKQLYPKAVLKGIVKFADVDCYQIELTATDGQSQTRYYAKDTLLPIGLEMVAESPMGKVPVKVISSDWRDENGFKYPHKIARVEAAQAIDVIIEKVETNVPIAADKFEPSDEIKQLAAAAPK